MINVREHGASGDGETLDTAALQRAINACSGAGGGQVLLPAGTYLTSTLRLRSGVELHLEKGARLLGVSDRTSYTGPDDDPDNRWLHALIVGEDVHDIALTGPGILDGNKVRDPQGEEKMRGPHTVLLRRCRSVRLSDITIRDSGNYAFLFYATEGVRVENVLFEGGWDGLHYRELHGKWNKDVRVTGCHFYTGDDSIAGSGVENFLMDNCVVNSSCNGVRLIGPARGWTITHCTLFGPGKFPHITQNRYNMLAGLNLQPSAWDNRPGPLEDVVVRDVTMKNVLCAFHVVTRQGNTASRLLFERVSATLSGAQQAASSVESWGERTFDDVVFRDIVINCAGGGTGETASLIQQPGVGTRALPVWGFYARNLKSLTLERVRLTSAAADQRPVFRADNVLQLRLAHVESITAPAPVEPFVFNDVREVERDDTPRAPAAPQPG